MKIIISSILNVMCLQFLSLHSVTLNALNAFLLQLTRSDSLTQFQRILLKQYNVRFTEFPAHLNFSHEKNVIMIHEPNFYCLMFESEFSRQEVETDIIEAREVTAFFRDAKKNSHNI